MRPIQVTVHHEGQLYQTAVDAGMRADELLLKSVYHFGIDPTEKSDYVLKPEDAGRDRRGLYLDRPVGDQLLDGAQLVLERNDTDTRGLSTGHY